MLLVFSLSVVLVHGVCCLASEAESRPVPHLHEHQLSRYVESYRSKRSMPAVINALLRSTRTGKKSSNEYWKRGSYKDALKDFKKLKPTNISRTQASSNGIVGNKMVRLYRGWGSTGDIAFIKIIDVYEKNGILIERSKDAITVSYRRPAGKY